MLKPVITLMIKCPSLSATPWKIVSWFLWLLLVSETIEAELLRLCNYEIDVPSDTIMPTLSKHWEELTSSKKAEECRFQGLHVVEGWIVTGQKDATSVQDAGAKKKNVT